MKPHTFLGVGRGWGLDGYWKGGLVIGGWEGTGGVYQKGDVDGGMGR